MSFQRHACLRLQKKQKEIENIQQFFSTSQKTFFDTNKFKETTTNVITRDNINIPILICCF